MNKKKILSIIGTIAAIIASYFAYEYIMYESTDNAQIVGHTVMLAPKVAGYIVQVNVVEGQKVAKDDVIAEIDSRDYVNTLTQIKGELTSVQAKMRDAEKNYRRLIELYQKGAVSQQQYDTTSSAYSEVKAKYDAVAAQVAQAELNLANTKMRAPMDGFIAKRAVENGQFASVGVPLFGFVGATERWVIANFKETQIDKIRIGSLVDIDVDAVSGKSFSGKVESVSAATGATFTLLPPDNATGNFTKVVQRVPVKIKIENLTEADIVLLRAGLSANVKVHKH